MPSHRLTLVALALAAGAGGSSANAQVVTTTVKDPALLTRVAPIASVSITLPQMTGTIEGGEVWTAFVWASLSPKSNWVSLRGGAKSMIHVRGFPLTNGLYTVQFTFSSITPYGSSTTPPTVVIRGRTSIVATCAVQNQPQGSSTSQRCEASGIEVADGQLLANLEFADNSADGLVGVSQITVSRYR